MNNRIKEKVHLLRMQLSILKLPFTSHRAFLPDFVGGHGIWGKRLGIAGIGRIGMALARRAKGFRALSVHHHTRRPVPEDIDNALEATLAPTLHL